MVDRRTALLTFLGFSGFASRRASAQRDANRGVAVLRPNLVYGVVGGKSLRLDAYLPGGRRPAPAIVLLHGGGFTGGAKGGYTGELARYLADRGYAAFDIDYRLMGDLGPGATLQKAVSAAQEDLHRAVEHVVAESKTYAIDPDRLAVGGGSAGAIAALLATYGDGRSKRRPKAVVSLWGGMYGQEKAIKTGDPPVLLVHGTADRTVPFAHSESIAIAARRAGIEPVLLRIENGGHTLPLSQRFQGRTILESVAEFLDERLREAP
jgi:acetyl esterase/lipase